MRSSQVAHLCTVCDLGTPLGVPQAVPGGFLHNMWRLHTTRGTYAVKQLNPALIRQPDMYDFYRLKERIAAAMAENGIPAVAALPCQGDFLQRCEDDVFLVSCWMNGEPLLLKDITSEHVRQVGVMLARMHVLQLPQTELTPLIWKPFSDDDWDMLTIHAADMGVPWAYQVRAGLPRLIEWSRWYEEAGHVLSATLVVSHCNLDPMDVIWKDAQAFSIVDWEAAGLINPMVELVATALRWSGFPEGKPLEEHFAAFIQGYVQAGGTVQETGRTALHGCIGIWLGWLLFNMSRSLGIAVSNDEERQFAIKQTLQTLTIVRSLAENVETWADWVDTWL
jgi:aminoglycoside phosphotransferase (APT) family kinase protein